MSIASASIPIRQKRKSFWLGQNVFTALFAGIVAFVFVVWVLGRDGGPLNLLLGLEFNEILFLGYIAGCLAFFAGLGFFNYPARWLFGYTPTPEDQLHAYGQPGEASRYFRLSLDHKVIGIQYLVVVLFFFCVAGFTAMLIRTELLTPNVRLVDPGVYLSLVTEHSVTMLIVTSSVIIGPFINYMLPLMIGSRRMAYPHIEALSFWTFLLSLLILPTMFFWGGDQSGWTGYAPLGDQMHAGHDAYLVTWALAGVSMTVSGINILGTVLLMRAPGMSWTRLNISAWAAVVASILAWLAAPILIAVCLMVAFDRAFLTGLFLPVQGGSAFLYENLFWTFGHPEVYILAVPSFGIVLEVISVFARRPIYAYKAAIVAMFGIGLLSWFVWQHHLFMSGLTPGLRPFFMFSTEMISFPTGIIFLAGLGTLFGARIHFNTAMLFAVAFFPNFLLGGFTGIFVSDVPADVQLHGSYFVQAHFHFVVMGGTFFGLFAAVFYWFPKMTGRRLSERLGRMQFWSMWIGFNGTFITLTVAGLLGMSRRYATYEPSLQVINQAATVFAYLLGISMLPFLVNIVYSWRFGEKAVDNVWGARSLEWQTATPVPLDNFEEVPLIVAGPYSYGVPNAKPMAILKPSEQGTTGIATAGN